MNDEQVEDIMDFVEPSEYMKIVKDRNILLERSIDMIEKIDSVIYEIESYRNIADKYNDTEAVQAFNKSLELIRGIDNGR